jgi:hypothetical protein
MESKRENGAGNFWVDGALILHQIPTPNFVKTSYIFRDESQRNGS